jgi:transcriptional regulator with XRE-family HTH domain
MSPTVKKEAVKQDAEIAVIPYTETFGYQIMSRRAARNLTEEQLATELNKKVEVDLVKKEHVDSWQNNQNLDMLADNKPLHDALKYVLIDMNDALKDKPEEKERLHKHFDTLLEQAIEHPSRSEVERQRYEPRFGRALTALRGMAKLDEDDLARMVNMRLSEVANKDTPSVTKQDIVDFQAGIKLPDERTQARLASVLDLDPPQAKELRASAIAAKEELQQVATVGR